MNNKGNQRKSNTKLKIKLNRQHTYFCSEEGTLGRTGFDGVFRLLGSAFLLGLQSKLTVFYTIPKKSLIYSFFFNYCHYCLILGNNKEIKKVTVIFTTQSFYSHPKKRLG